MINEGCPKRLCNRGRCPAAHPHTPNMSNNVLNENEDAAAARAVYVVNRRSNVGILGVNWAPSSEGLAELSDILNTLSTDVKLLRFEYCLGQQGDMTPVNTHRRLRVRHRSCLEELHVLFYVTSRDGRRLLVSNLHLEPTRHQLKKRPTGVEISPRLTRLLGRNRLIQQAQGLSEPLKAPQGERISSTSSCSSTTTERHALWGKAITSLAGRKNPELTSSALFTLLQKNPNYLPRGMINQTIL